MLPQFECQRRGEGVQALVRHVVGHPADTVVRPGKGRAEICRIFPVPCLTIPGNIHAVSPGQAGARTPTSSTSWIRYDRRFHQVGTVIPGSLVVPDMPAQLTSMSKTILGIRPHVLRLYAELSAQVPVTLELAATSRCWMSVEFHDARSAAHPLGWHVGMRV